MMQQRLATAAMAIMAMGSARIAQQTGERTPVDLDHLDALVPFLVLGFSVAVVVWLGQPKSGMHPLAVILGGCVWGGVAALTISGLGFDDWVRVVGVALAAAFAQSIVVKVHRRIGRLSDKKVSESFAAWLQRVIRAAIGPGSDSNGGGK